MSPFLMPAVVCAALLIIVSCADAPPNNANTVCVDEDGDGFGQGCDAGPDCDDLNAVVQVCDCSMDNFQGCPCEEGQTETCFEGLEDQLGVGQCRAGTRRCEGGLWSVCQGQRTPVAETCNGRDDNCDGTPDEGLEINACGSCDETCTDDGVGPGRGLDWQTGDGNPVGLKVDDDGALVLDESPQAVRFNFVWIANDEEGTVSKLDAVTGREVARYVSARRVADGMPESLTRCEDGGNCPSRTAVDLRGDVWVANRAFEAIGSVTRIAHRRCVDQDEDGVIQTSQDVSGDGRIDINDPQEFLGEADECVLFTVPVGDSNAIPRGLAVDPFHPVEGVGSVWVGLWTEQRYVQIDAASGEILQSVQVPHRPYGAVLDRFGILWSVTKDDPDSGLVSVRAQDAEVTGTYPIESTNGCANSYGVTVDRNGHIWTAGVRCDAAYRFDPTTGQWLTVAFGVGGSGRGIVADVDGQVYASISHIDGERVAKIARFGEDGTGLEIFDIPDGVDTVGVGLDHDGMLWGVNRRSNNAVRMDPDTGQMDLFPTGEGPYTYSDFTGFTLGNFVAPQGSYRHLFEGCPTQSTARWHRLAWDAQVPEGTSVTALIRVADTIDGLAVAPVRGPFVDAPVDLLAAMVPEGNFMEVELVLTTDAPGQTPRVHSLEAASSCPPID